MNQILPYRECFDVYPNQWVSLEAVTRDETNGGLVKGKVIRASCSKQEILNESKRLKKLGYGVAIISTIEMLEEVVSVLYSDNGLKQQE